MNILCQKDYTARVKNAMLLHFNHKEIRSTLKDINELFETGKEYGKTEKELCNELGNPKDFVSKLLHDEHHDKFAYNLFTYFIGALVICAVAAYIYKPLNPIYWCIFTVIVPAYIWHLCGGSCLFELQNGFAKHKIVYWILNAFALISVVVQQFFALLLNTSGKIRSSDTFMTCLRLTYYLSMFLIVMLILFSVFIIYKLYHGDYLSLSVLLPAIGSICSSLSYISYIMSFNGPNALASVCSLPYMSGIILYLLSSHYLRKKGAN